MEYIDLGLSVKWADRNAGANSPEEFGGYFNYNEAEKIDGITLPTIEQWDELQEKCKFKFDKKKNGFTVKGANGNSIFFPVAGVPGGNNEYPGGYFWSSTPIREKYVWFFFIVRNGWRSTKIKTDKKFMLKETYRISVRGVK